MKYDLESMTREELTHTLCEMIKSAPRGVALEWLHRCLLPILDANNQKGGGA